VVIDIWGQKVSSRIIDTLTEEILQATDNGMNVIFKGKIYK